MFLLIELFGYRLPEPELTDLLLFVAFLSAAIIGTVWLRFSPVFRKILLETITDVTGRADAKLITAAWITALITMLLIRGSVFDNKWPPIDILNSLLVFVSALMGLDAANTIASILKPKKDEKPTPPDEETEDDVKY